MTDISTSCKWKDHLENRPPHLEIKDKEAKVRQYNYGNTLVGVLAISLFLEINGRGRNSDLYGLPGIRVGHR